MSKDLKKKRRNALGKGLSALLDDSDMTILPKPGLVSAGSVSEIPIDIIETNPYQPRQNFDLVALEELATSIRSQGLIQPITIRRLSQSAYQLISGERRLQASKLAGKVTIPAYIRTANDEQMLEMALIENIQREDLNPVEISMAYERLVSELDLTLEELAARVGKKRATVNNYIRLLKLPPEIQIGLKENKISMGHARALLGLEHADQRLYIYREILEKQISVRAVEEAVRKMSAKAPSNKIPKPPVGRKSPFISDLEDRLEEKFGNRVMINQQGSGKGEIKVTFDSTEDLNRILGILELR